MIIHSDWHIHSENSYDATLTPDEIAKAAIENGFRNVGITDHVNFNDKKFLTDLKNSAKNVGEAIKKYPFIVLGTELTPIEKPEFDYIAKHGTREGYVAPISSEPFPIELAVTKDELVRLGVRYAIGASHWRVDKGAGDRDETDLNACIKEWYRQQLFLACDERVTVLGHPWYHGKSLWYQDFSVIPHSMNMEIAAALKENGKYVECNSGMICASSASEKFKRQYGEFLRELFEMGIPVTFGTDSHKSYSNAHLVAEKYLIAAGFRDGDIAEIKEKDLW